MLVGTLLLTSVTLSQAFLPHPSAGPQTSTRASLSRPLASLKLQEVDTLARPVGETDCWRPTIDDVDRISWGRNAKQKGTGSRGVPHRLNDDERTLYDFARRKGFVEIGGSGWRRQRSDAPLVNTFRSWCDARGKPAIYLHKGRDGTTDEVIVDLSPLRTPLAFEEAAAFCLCESPDGSIEFEGRRPDPEKLTEEDTTSTSGGNDDGTAQFSLEDLTEDYLRLPIYRLPMYAVSWIRVRAEAKELAKRLAERLDTAEAAKGSAKGRRKERGAPNVKPGKSRKSGGYGIG